MRARRVFNGKIESMYLSKPAYCRPAAYSAFAEQLADMETTAGLLRGAFAITLHECPEADFDALDHAISSLTASVRQRLRSDDPKAVLAHLHDVLFDVMGFAGNADDYYNATNSYLPDVVRTRRGIPISLVLVYKCVGERLGLKVYGVNAPGHFLAAVETKPLTSRKATLMYVDPFYSGTLLSCEEALQRVEQATGKSVARATDVLTRATHRQWLFRMLNNLQVIFAYAGRERDIYAMQELQSLLNSR